MPATSRGNSGGAIAIAFTALASLTLAARLYTRYVLVKNAGLEEWAIIFAWAFSLTHTALVGVQIHNGLGDHSWNLTGLQQEHIYLPFWVSVPMYSIALFLTKVSILLLYLRLFPQRWFAISCKITIAVMAAFLVWTIFGFMFMCKPVEYFWNKSIDGHCMNPKIVYFTNAPFNILTDFVLFFLPLRTLAQLQLPRKQKTGLMLLFAIGLLGCLTSILRLRSLYYLSISHDITYDNLDIAIWSCVEVNVGICCACIPTLKPLIVAISPRLLLNTRSNATRSNAYGMNPLNSDVALTNSQTNQTSAQFDKDCEIQLPRPGEVKVTSVVKQDISRKPER